MNNNIFITFNPNSEAEQNTALRLQTISNLYGLAVSLPYRQANLASINTETKNRIKNSTFIVAFCLQELSPQLTEELNFAISLKKPIVVIFDNNLGKTIHFTDYDNIKECFVDFNQYDKSLTEIAKFIRAKIPAQTPKKLINQPSNKDKDLGIALLGIGLGLLAIWALTEKK